MARILTGIQSSGKPHLGNILGAIKPSIILSKDPGNQSLFFIADLHSLINIKDSNAIHALAKGASDGLKLALNIAAMLLAFLAVVYMLNYFLDFFGDITTINQWIKSSSGGQFNKLSMEFLLGQIFRLFAFMIGINWNETVLVGSLLGQKFVLNEFIAYVNLAEMKASGLLSEKSILISTYALCGFANFSSIAIQIGGIGSMAPSRQKDISKLGLRALIAATLATLLTGNIAGFIIA